MSVEYRVDDRRHRAAVWLPDDFDPGRRWPLLLFLHASGERGAEMEHLAVGIGPALHSHPDLYPCIVLMPQCPRDLVWSVVDRPWAEGCGSAEAHIDAALETALQQFPVDPARVALTGASMGGFGTFVYGARNAARFSTFGPVCGGGIPDEVGALAERPVWVYHGAADDIVPCAESREMVAAIRAAGGPGPLQYTEVEGAGHDVWDLAYRDPGFVRFLLGGGGILS